MMKDRMYTDHGKKIVKSNEWSKCYLFSSSSSKKDIFRTERQTHIYHEFRKVNKWTNLKVIYTIPNNVEKNK